MAEPHTRGKESNSLKAMEASTTNTNENNEDSNATKKRKTPDDGVVEHKQPPQKERKTTSSNDQEKSPKRPVRVWVDGCFDLMHFGHANALRQARELGDVLIVGVHSDEDILKHKGPTVMKEHDRYAAVRACKWADEVVEGAPFVTSLEILDSVNADFCVHGDDISLSATSGQDTYAAVKGAGRFKEVPRTRGISTTDIVGRLLLCTKSHHKDLKEDESPVEKISKTQGVDVLSLTSSSKKSTEQSTAIAHFLPTTRRITQFSSGRVPKKTDKIVYIDGAWDLFHIGHIKVLQKAKELGDFLIVGVVDDKTVNAYKGGNFPIMNLFERVLTVLSCRYVDEVVIGAPMKVSERLIRDLNISHVVHGTRSASLECPDGSDPYAAAKKLGVYTPIQSPSDMTTSQILSRIIENRRVYVERNRKKKKTDTKSAALAEELKNKGK